MTSQPSGEHVVIVGAGIVGIACAHYLAKAGMKVTVLDQGTVAGACSHGNCGYICPSHVLPLTEPHSLWLGAKSIFNPQAPFRIKPSVRPALWHWMMQFAKRCNHKQMLMAAGPLKAMLDSSLNEYKRLVRDEQLDCEWHEQGLLYVFQTASGLDKFAESDRFLTEHFGVSAHRIEGGDLPVFEPALKPGLAGAFHYPGDASVRPDLLNRAWVDRLRARGVEFIEQCSLTGIRKKDGVIVGLDTSLGAYDADRFVFAVGAWSSKLEPYLGCSIPVEPGKGYSITMKRPKIMPRHPILFPEHKVGVSPFEQGIRLGSMMEFVGFDASIPPARIQQLRDSAKPYLGEQPVPDADSEIWYGWRPMTWDSLPIVGQVPNLDNGYLATGHNMLGLTLAPATGLLLSEMMMGKTPHIDPEPYSLSRFL